MVSRTEWDAHEPGSFGNQTPGAEKYEGLYPNSPDGYKMLDDPAGSYIGIAIHHEGDDETFDPKRVQESEMNAGFYDIGYHYVIGPDGTIYEGRNVNVRGNAAYPNSQNISILWLGDFNPGYGKNDGRYGQTDPSDWTPTQEQYQATADLVEWLDNQYGITAIWGHRDVPGGLGTVCPGDNAMPMVNRLKEAFGK